MLRQPDDEHHHLQDPGLPAEVDYGQRPQAESTDPPVEVGTGEGCLTLGLDWCVRPSTASTAGQITSITPTTPTPVWLRRSRTRACQSSQTATARSATATTQSTSKVYRTDARASARSCGTEPPMSTLRHALRQEGFFG